MNTSFRILGRLGLAAILAVAGMSVVPSAWVDRRPSTAAHGAFTSHLQRDRAPLMTALHGKSNPDAWVDHSAPLPTA